MFVQNILVPFLIFIVGISIYLNNENFDTFEMRRVPPNPYKTLPPSGTRMSFFKKYGVTSAAGPCAKVGKAILERNGSAVDSAISSLLCNTVVKMQSSGIGGGFFMVIFNKEEQKVYVLNAREMAPSSATLNLFDANSNSTKTGGLAIAVPGEIKGYMEAHKRFGKLPWIDLIQPVIDLCDRGFVMSKHHYYSLLQRKVNEDENLGNWFYYKNGTVKKLGSKIYPKKLCNTLKELQLRGGDDFYNGHLSKIILEDIKEAGGIITKEDFINYKAEWQEPIHVRLNDYHLYTAPPPSSGVLLASILNVLQGFKFNRGNLNEPYAGYTYHLIIEAFKHAFAARNLIGDPNFVPTEEIIKLLLSEKYAKKIRSIIKRNHPSFDSDDYNAGVYWKEDHGTAHLSIMSENGDAVSVTSTINLHFGAGLTSKRTGIIFNSAMEDFYYPNKQSYFGLYPSQKNGMLPGKRPLSSMSPSILIDKNGNVKTVIGGAGGPQIITSVALTLMRLLWFGDNLKEAIDAPRIHHQMFPMEVRYEYGLLDIIIKDLELIGHKMVRGVISGVHALHREKSHIVGTTCPRYDDDGVYGV